ncbi:MAG: NusG domain II-containing protein [Clostridia bacterium]|nr:NusG domain II-containing protein [Clostridia bacterium]
MNNIPFFKKSDLLIIGIFLLIALVIFLPTLSDSEKTLTAVITAYGETLTEISLTDSTQEEIKINGTVIKINGKTVFFAESNCPDKVCVKTGNLDSQGDSSACVPNRVSVYIKGEKTEDDIDIMAY